MKVRDLTAKDVRMVVGVMGKELPRLTKDFARGENESREQHAARLGGELAAILLERHIDTLWSWIADLGSMTPEQLDEADASAPFEIMEKVLTGQSAVGFFERAQASITRITETIASRKSGTE